MLVVGKKWSCHLGPYLSGVFPLVPFLVGYPITFSIHVHRYLTLLAHAPIPETGSRSPEHGGSDGLSGTHHACVVLVLVVACVAHLLIR